LSGVEENTYLTYCNGTKVIYALEINEIFKFNNPIDPFKIISDFKPPQSFTYLDGSKIYKTLENG